MAETSRSPPSRAVVDPTHKTEVDSAGRKSPDSVGGEPSPGGSGGGPQPNGLNGDAAHRTEKRISGGDDWDREWDDEELEDDELVLQEDPDDMAQWTGQASVKGSSEIMRMVLLTFSSIGIT